MEWDGRIVDFVITEHARWEMQRRGLTLALIESVMRTPEQCLEVRQGRMILQSRRKMLPTARVYLIRVVVDVHKRPVEVVTAYRTTKIAKYWRPAE